MSDPTDSATTTSTPDDLREDVEKDLQDLVEESKEQEAARMAERERLGVDEPNGDGDISLS